MANSTPSLGILSGGVVVADFLISSRKRSVCRWDLNHPQARLVSVPREFSFWAA